MQCVAQENRGSEANLDLSKARRLALAERIEQEVSAMAEGAQSVWSGSKARLVKSAETSAASGSMCSGL